MGYVFGGVVFVVFLVYSAAQIYAGYLGIEHHLGVIWAFVAIAAAFVFRFTLPMTVGAFFGAMDVWGWHWALALIFAAPGLAFVVPGVLASIFSAVRQRHA